MDDVSEFPIEMTKNTLILQNIPPESPLSIPIFQTFGHDIRIVELQQLSDSVKHSKEAKVQTRVVYGSPPTH